MRRPALPNVPLPQTKAPTTEPAQTESIYSHLFSGAQQFLAQNITHDNRVTIRRVPCTAIALEAVLADARELFWINFPRWLDAWIASAEADERRSDATFADKLKVSRSTVHGWRNAKIGFDAEQLGPICDVLGCRIWQLFVDTNDTRKPPRLVIDPVLESYKELGEKLGYRVRADKK